MTTTPPCFTPRAAIYAHTATKRENINDQIAICKAFAEAQGWRVAGVYADRNTQNLRTSGPEISRLKDDAAAGEFDVVLCQHVDRITPNIWE